MTAETAFKILSRTRQSLNEMIADLDDLALLKIPAGFNNNILWNLGHVVVSQQLLSYHLSGLAVNVSEDLLSQFRRGSSPQNWAKPINKTELTELSLALVDKTLKDYRQGVFQESHRRETLFPYQTSFGGKLENFPDAVHFNNVHEGLHFGTIKLYKSLLNV